MKKNIKNFIPLWSIDLVKEGVLKVKDVFVIPKYVGIYKKRYSITYKWEMNENKINKIISIAKKYNMGYCISQNEIKFWKKG